MKSSMKGEAVSAQRVVVTAQESRVKRTSLAGSALLLHLITGLLTGSVSIVEAGDPPLLATIPVATRQEVCFGFDFPTPSEIIFYLGHDTLDTLAGQNFPNLDPYWVQASLPVGELGEVDVTERDEDFDRLVELLTNGVEDPHGSCRRCG